MDDGPTRLEKTTRARVGDQPRGDPLPEWDVFVRDEGSGPMRHVGSVSASSPAAAHEHATRLFGWFASDVWVCESSDLYRFSTRSLGEQGEDATPDSGTEPRTHEL
jgi:rSAM-partnered protein